MKKVLDFLANNPLGNVIKIAIYGAISYALTSTAFNLDPWTTMVLTGILASLGAAVNPMDMRFGKVAVDVTPEPPAE